MEEWKSIAIAPNYFVSNEGRVKRVIQTKTGVKERILILERHSAGYRRVSLCLPSRKVLRQYVHRLVAENFVSGRRPETVFVCHRDGVRANNHVANLYWGTQVENMADAARHGTFKPVVPRRGELHPHTKVTEEQVRAIRCDGRTLKEIGETYGIHFATVHGIKTRKTWGHVV